MLHDLMDILACPADHGNLALTIDREDANDIIDGLLTCDTCGEKYPIVDSVPNLLPAELR